MRDEIDRILIEFKNGLLTLGDARNKILELISEEIKKLLIIENRW